MTIFPASAMAAILSVSLNPELEGRWGGELDIGQAQLRIEIVLDESNGSWSGELISVNQNNARVPATSVTVDGNRVVIDLAAASARYEGTLTQDGQLDGEFQQVGQTFELDMDRIAETALADPARLRNENDREIRVQNDQVTLAGSLRLPEGANSVPGVVFISGSGPQDRDMTVGEHRVFLILAEHLAEAGIASLRLDDRGVGDSDAIIPHHPQDIADDMSAALAELRRQPGINGQCVGFIGHSEGGSLAFMAAGISEPNFILSLAGMHASMADTLLEQGEAIIRASGGSDADVAAQRAVQDVVMTALRDAPTGEAGPAIEAGLIEAGLPEQIARQQAMIWGQAYAQNALDLDPAPYMQAYPGVFSALFGGSDLQVLANAMSERVVSARGALPTRVNTLAGHNHLFQLEASGLPTGYTTAPHAMSPEALAAIVEEVQSLIDASCQ